MALAHPLDHIVLPTASLATARERLMALGFTVAPNGIHPFGTENCCVYFAGDTFMEPLAIADADAVRKAITAGNVFVARDRAYRDRLGGEGFSAIVFATQDADADHACYVAAGISAGGRLDFSRPFVDSAGNSDIASFRLAFAVTEATPESFVFSCERVNAPEVDRTALQIHANGVTGISEIVALASDPASRHAFLHLAAGKTDDKPVRENTLVLPNATITVLDPAGFEERFSVPAGQPSKLRFAVVVFSVADLAAMEKRLALNGIAHHVRGDSLIVTPAPGQGATFVFREVP